MEAICAQLTFELKKFNAHKKSIRSVFIGGGTPSTIEATLYTPFFTLLKPYLSKGAEITSEANPHSASMQWLSGMKALGVNRVSFGVQSFDAKKLTFLGRNHTSSMAIEAIHTAYNLGILNISLDLIYATAVDTLTLLENDLRIARSLPINHLSAYALTLEEETPFFKQANVTNPSEALAKAFVKKIINTGFAHYEISNFGTYQSRHNKGYWEQDDYIGIGCGAVGFLKDKRFYPSKNVDTYIQNPLFQESELLSSEDLAVERIFLGLRSVIGIDETLLSPSQKEKATLLVKEKKLTCEEGRLYNSDYFLSDEIALFILG